jgi:hypothetical protein
MFPVVGLLLRGLSRAEDHLVDPDAAPPVP